MSDNKIVRLGKSLLAGALALGCCLSFAACGNTEQGKDDMTDTERTQDTGTETETEKPRLYDTTLSEEFVERDGETLAVRFCREDLVHFRYLPEGDEFAPEDAVPESIAKYDGDYAPVFGERVEDDATVTLRTEGVTVTVNKATLQITVTDPAGDPVFSSAAEAFRSDGTAKTASFKRDVAGTEHFFGLGNDKGSSFTTTDHRNTEYQIWMHDDNVHAIIPLWYSTSGYGVYSNNSNRGTVSFKNDYHLSVEDGELNFYFLYGPEFKTILSNWSELCGRMSMPPLYALGLTYRGYSKWTDAQILSALTAQLDSGIKIDVAGVEPGWQTHTYPCTYAWSSTFTSDAESFVEAAHELGLHVNLWEHPYIYKTATIYNAIKELSLTGADLGTRAWEGNSGNYAFDREGLVPDLTIEEARELYWEIQDENLASIGVDGYKIDETDSWGASDSLTTLFPSGISSNAYHNLLGTLTVNLMHEKYRDDYNMRTFIFSRGNYAGMQRYATTAYTDYYGFDQFVMSILAQSYSGTYYTPEIRDVSTKSDVDYMRRAQLMFLTPFAMSNEYATESSVLDRSDAVIKCYKKYNDLHYALIPYMYSLFWEQYNTGIGVTRSLVMEFQNDPKVYSIDKQFMLGSALMVCPVSDQSRIATVRIYLPAGENWMDFNSGYVYEGGQTISYTCGADTLPLFVRMGSILPLGHYGNNTSQVTDPDLTLDIYPSQQVASFTVYEDDGISYDYTKGKYSLTGVTAVLESGRIVCTAASSAGSSDPRDYVLQIHYRTAPSEVTLDGAKLSAAASLEAFRSSTGPCWFYDGAAERDIDRILYVRFHDDGRAHTVSAAVGPEGEQTLPDVVMNGSLYECESDSANLEGFRKTALSGASGQNVARASGSGTSALTLTGIRASETAFYEIEILYYNGDAEERLMTFSVNDGDPITLHFYPSGGTNVAGTLALTVPLKKGTNTIRMASVSGKVPDLDAVIVYDGDPVNTDPKGTIYLAGEAVLEGGLVLGTNVGAYDKEAVSGFGSSETTAMTWTVHVDSYGPYQLGISFSNPDQTERKLDLYVNGEKSEILLPGTASPEVFKTVSVTVYLDAGDNTISLGCRGGDAIYECETGGEYKNCNTRLNDGGTHVHSGGYAVGATGNNGAFSFTMKGIEVPESGTYRMLVYCGSGDTRTFRLKVNGKEVGDLYSVRTGHFHVFQPTEIAVDLKKGENTLTFWQESTEYGDTLWVPNFDYVRIEGVTARNDVSVAWISIQ